MFGGIIGTAISGIGNAARNLFSGESRKRRKAIRQARREKRKEKATLTAGKKEAKASQLKDEARDLRSTATKDTVMSFVKSWWWVVAICLGLVITVRYIFPQKKKVGSRSRKGRSSSSSKSSASKTPRKTSSGKKETEFMRRMRLGKLKAKREREAGKRK